MQRCLPWVTHHGSQKSTWSWCSAVSSQDGSHVEVKKRCAERGRDLIEAGLPPCTAAHRWGAQCAREPEDALAPANTMGDKRDKYTTNASVSGQSISVVEHSHAVLVLGKGLQRVKVERDGSTRRVVV